MIERYHGFFHVKCYKCGAGKLHTTYAEAEDAYRWEYNEHGHVIALCDKCRLSKERKEERA